MTIAKRFLAYLSATALLTLAATPAFAQSYPNRPIRFIVGFGPGTVMDVSARLLANQVSKDLQQSVIVENKVGANGLLASHAVFDSEADGYTVLISNSSSITLFPLINKSKMRFDVQKDLAPVSLVMAAPLVLTINPNNPKTKDVQSLAELVNLAKRSPGQLSFGSAGVGNITQLAFEMINARAGVKMLHVAYKGGQDAQMGLLGNEVDAQVDSLVAAPLIKAGKLRALAVTSPTRWQGLPEVPTVAEQGYPGFDLSFWVAALVPKNTPREVVERLAASFKRAAQEPATKTEFEKYGNVVSLGPNEFAARIDEELKRNAEIIKHAGIRVE